MVVVVVLIMNENLRVVEPMGGEVEGNTYASDFDFSLG